MELMKRFLKERAMITLLGSAVFFCPAQVVFSQPPLTRHDLDSAASEYLMTISAPDGATPEAILETILENPKLPKHIRDPFVAIARVNAPHLLAKYDNPR